MPLPDGPRGNDWGCDGIMHCCTGNGSRAIYYVWEHMLDCHDGRLRINMLLNRASPWADVYSHLPRKGLVEVKMKRTCAEVAVRAPEWIDSGSPEVTCAVNGESVSPKWLDRYIDVGPGERGDRIVVAFPLSERTVKERIGTQDYTLVVRGSTVVSIDPPGKYCPLYQRDAYRTGDTIWRKVKRFVSDERIEW